ncbi:MAG: ATP-binding protein [Bacteroidales bacterium]|nr:ATP-binding protein [Bacteroidales bacterium]
MKRHLTLHNDIQEVPLLASFIDEVAEACGIDMALTMSLNLAMEEAVVNVMNYAYPKDTVGNVDIDAEFADGRLTFVLSDSGTPFDPTQAGTPDLTLEAEDRPIGGLGIFLVRQIMDHVDYQYSDGKNILTLSKNIQTINQ